MNSINSEAIFYGSTYTTKSGWKVTLQLPDEEAARALDAIGAGKRYMLALVPIGDDEQPDVDAMAKVEKPKRRLADMSLAQQAGILCNDERFWKYLGCTNPDTANDYCANYIRNYCGVKSRSDLDKKDGADAQFRVILTEFDVFTGRIAAP